MRTGEGDDFADSRFCPHSNHARNAFKNDLSGITKMSSEKRKHVDTRLLLEHSLYA